MMLSVMVAAALAGWNGVVSPQTEGWTFQASGAKDGMVYNPFEGTFPDKGGRLVSPEIALPQSAVEGGYYRLAFTAESEARAFEGVNYFAADGRELPDRYDVIYPGKAKYDRVFYAMPGTARARVFFQGDRPFKVSDVTVEPVTWKEAADYADRVLAAIPKCAFTAPADAFALLPRTRAAMAEGRPWRVVMLGDSNSQDLYHSLFHALVKREFPKSDLRFLVSMRGSTGVAWYGEAEHPERIAEYVAGPKPDLLVIGGATNFRCGKKPEIVAECLARVVRAAKAAGAEVLVNTPMPAMDTRLNPWTPNFNPDLTKDLGPMEFDVKKNFWCAQTYFPEVMRKVADGEKVAFWDFTAQGYEYIFRSGKPYQWFGRDDYHSGERGKQAWGRLYLEYWRTAKIPRPEHPKPQFERAEWINLNGDAWTFEFDFGQSGRDEGRELFKSKGFGRKIVVPFCPESSLSGVGYRDFIPAMWYHRRLEVPAAWEGKRVILHFGGVDYESEVYVNGRSAGFHFGGTSSFEVDLTPFVGPGESCDLVIRVADDTRGGSQPVGKQCGAFKSRGCHYTRTTGIWQTVWLEAVAPQGLADCQIVPDLDSSRFVFTPRFRGDGVAANAFRVTVLDEKGETVATVERRVASGASVEVPLKDVRAWSPEDPYLYGVRFEVVDAGGAVIDTVRSYAGMRKVHVADGKLFLNNKPRFLRFVLDQGFYPDGVWTAPTDADLKRDIELSMACGFNGARLHQKVFEERFHYWADRLGYLTWGESSSWGADPNSPLAARNFLAEWGEIVRRDRNHPSIIAWTPFNETWDTRDILQHQRTQNDAYFLCKAIDPTRPVNTASGDLHSKTDIWTIHHYARAPELDVVNVPAGRVWAWREEYDGIVSRVYEGQPYMIDEFGGLAWVPPERRHADNTWGYGNDIKTEDEFFGILRDELDVILKGSRLWGYCYTQLTDVEQEQNGLCYFDRTPKFDVGKLRAVFGKDPVRN